MKRILTLLALPLFTAMVPLSQTGEEQAQQWEYLRLGKIDTYTLRQNNDTVFKLWCGEDNKTQMDIVSEGKSYKVEKLAYVENVFGIDVRTFPKEYKDVLQQKHIDVLTEEQIFTFTVAPTTLQYECN